MPNINIYYSAFFYSPGNNLLIRMIFTDVRAENGTFFRTLKNRQFYFVDIEVSYFTKRIDILK